jgi:hypothetical protein
MTIEGFETPEKLVGYVEMHSRTPRALFHWTHIKALYEVAGEEPVAVLSQREFWAFHWAHNSRVIQKARKRLTEGAT